MAHTLASRDLTAVDGAPVAETAVLLGRPPKGAFVTFVVTTTGTPTTYDMRGAVEASNDGGTTWHQVCRFRDVTNVVPASRFSRFAALGAATEAPIAASDLSTAATSGVVVDTPWPQLIRAVTKLQTLTGGTAPHILITMILNGQ